MVVINLETIHVNSARLVIALFQSDEFVYCDLISGTTNGVHLDILCCFTLLRAVQIQFTRPTKS